jgi:hypothetical protein
MTSQRCFLTIDGCVLPYPVKGQGFKVLKRYGCRVRPSREKGETDRSKAFFKVGWGQVAAFAGIGEASSWPMAPILTKMGHLA